MNVEEVGAAPWLGAWPLGCPSLPYKRPPSPPHNTHLLVKDLSPPLEFIPHGLGLARYMFPVAIREERVVLPLHRWSEEAEVARCLERVTDCGSAAGTRRRKDRLRDLEIGKSTTTSPTRICSR